MANLCFAASSDSANFRRGTSPMGFRRMLYCAVYGIPIYWEVRYGSFQDASFVRDTGLPALPLRTQRPWRVAHPVYAGKFERAAGTFPGWAFFYTASTARTFGRAVPFSLICSRQRMGRRDGIGGHHIAPAINEYDGEARLQVHIRLATALPRIDLKMGKWPDSPTPKPPHGAGAPSGKSGRRRKIRRVGFATNTQNHRRARKSEIPICAPNSPIGEKRGCRAFLAASHG